MELHEAVKIVRRCANFSTYKWDEDKIQDWVSVVVRWDRDLTLKALETHVLAKKLDNLADLRATYEGFSKRAAESRPQLERGRPDADEMMRVKDMLAQFRREHPKLWSSTKANGAPAVPVSPQDAPKVPETYVGSPDPGF